MPNKKAKQRKRIKILKRKEIAEYKAKKRRERKDAREEEKEMKLMWPLNILVCLRSYGDPMMEGGYNCA